MKQQRVKVAPGVELDVRVWNDGTGRAFVLVHGLASNARMWDGVAAALQEAGHPVATLDLRGHGRSDKPDHGYDMARVADDVVVVVDALGWSRPVLAGQSWGGNVVLELAHRRPDVVAGVAGVDGGTIELSRRFAAWEACAEAMRPPATEGAPAVELEAMVRRLHPDWPEAGIAGMLANWEVGADGTVSPWLTLERHLLVLRGLWDHHPSQLYASIGAPVLFIPAAGGYSATDEAIGMLRRGRVHPLAGDHDLHAQHPAQVASILHDACEEGFFA